MTFLTLPNSVTILVTESLCLGTMQILIIHTENVRILEIRLLWTGCKNSVSEWNQQWGICEFIPNISVEAPKDHCYLSKYFTFQGLLCCKSIKTVSKTEYGLFNCPNREWNRQNISPSKIHYSQIEINENPST